MTDYSIDLKIKLLSDTAKLPTKANKNDACFDIYADIPDDVYYDGIMVIQPHKTVMVSSGFATEIPHGYWGAIFARSGLASKQGLRVSQGVAVIDEEYRGEWYIPLHNDTDETKIIRHGDRICQFMILPYFDTNLIKVNELSESERGENGFGSTGV